MRASALAGDLLDLFLPRACLGCGDRLPPEESGTLVCPRCRTLLRDPPSPRCPRCDLPRGTGQPGEAPCLECRDWPEILHSARSAVVMEPPADALVHALKYGGWHSLGALMGRRMLRAFPPPEAESVVVPVPTTSLRRRMRGYNQATVLAAVVAEGFGLPLLEALCRPRGGTQVRRGPRDRRSNVQGIFRIRSDVRSQIREREVILIDDVFTTGATVISAAKALGEGRARSVRVLTFARALPFGDDARRVSRL